MSFQNVLNGYLRELGLTAKELALESHISEATISRYRSGGRAPEPGSAALSALARGLAILGRRKGIELNEETILTQMHDALPDTCSFDSLRKKLGRIMAELGISTAGLAKSLSFDASYISRILNGGRKPSDQVEFAERAARFVARQCDTGSKHEHLLTIMGFPVGERLDTEASYRRLLAWLMDGDELPDADGLVDDFLVALDAFDLNNYIREVNFDDLDVPVPPLDLPLRKSYYGLEEMKEGELDFLKAALLSDAAGEAFMFSDMQMDNMVADAEFTKKLLLGLTLLLKKGLHVNVIHNLNRPLSEMMVGLESWIPLYMTGQISPHYLKGVHNSVFCHSLNVTETAALSGESIAGFHEKGRYYLCTDGSEVAYYRERADELLSKAQPLMDIYRSDRADAFRLQVANELQEKEVLHRYSTLPIYTLPEDELSRLLERNHLPAADRERISAFASEQREAFARLAESDLTDEIPLLSEDEFAEHPPSLDLSRMFYDRSVPYDYETYRRHFEHTICAGGGVWPLSCCSEREDLVQEHTDHGHAQQPCDGLQMQRADRAFRYPPSCAVRCASGHGHPRRRLA